MKTQTEKRTLLCPLNDRDREKVSRELAAASIDEEAIEAERKEVMADLRDRAKEAKAKTRALAHRLKSGDEREVECRVDVDVASKHITVVRLDSGEVVVDRAMNPDEIAKASQGAFVFNATETTDG